VTGIQEIRDIISEEKYKFTTTFSLSLSLFDYMRIIIASPVSILVLTPDLVHSFEEYGILKLTIIMVLYYFFNLSAEKCGY
jgi:hypothetical protein